MSKKVAGQRNRPRVAYSVYEQMDDPSLQKLWQSWGEFRVLKRYKRPTLETIEWWSKTYDWVERRKAFWDTVREKELKKKLETVIMRDEEILAITRAVMIRYGQQLHDNKQGKIEFGDVEKAVKIQRLIMGQPTDIGKHEVDVKDGYANLSDEELLSKLERFTKRYKEKLKQKNETDSR